MGVMPYGSMPIVQARKRGQRPADMVLISMIGSLPTEVNPVVITDKQSAYEWGWLRGLHACFWTHPKGYSAKHILDAHKADPAALYLWDCVNLKGYDISVLPTLDSIARPREQWIWRVQADRWLPFQEEAFSRGEATWN